MTVSRQKTTWLPGYPRVGPSAGELTDNAPNVFDVSVTKLLKLQDEDIITIR